MEGAGGGLVDSVRGRRLLWELLTPLHTSTPWWSLEIDGEALPDDEVLLPTLRSLMDVAGHGVLTTAELRVALAGTVDHARYWQPPAGLEHVLARPSVRTQLSRLAAIVAEATPAWWSAPVDTTVQHRVRWVYEAGPPDAPAPSLASWRASMMADEAAMAARHRESDRPWSGAWWSTPGYQLPTTTRAAEGLPAVHLALVEDESGWTEADVEPVTVAPGARLLEVTCADDWAALVARYPLEVTHSRRYDWAAATGRRGRWLLPDFAAVAENHDAVHVTVEAYLDTAGEAVPVPGRPDAATVLAGWSPDQTWWLRPELLTPGPARRWRRQPDAESPWDWEPVDAADPS